MRRRSSITLVAVAGLMTVAGCGPATSEAGQPPEPGAVPAPQVWTVTEDATPSDTASAPESSPAADPSDPSTPPQADPPPTASWSTAPTPPPPTRTVSAEPRPAAGAYDRPSRGGVELPPTGSGPLTGRTIVIDPGHNGVYVPSIDERLVDAGDGGRKACNTSGTANAASSEHALNWSVASLLVTDLRSRGATVWLTRPDDNGVGPCVDERAGIGNRVKADLVLSVHADGNTSASARGFHVITSAAMKGGAGVDARSQTLAALVRDRMVTTGMPISTYLGRKGIDVRRDIAGMNLSMAPAVMLEMGNMHHPQDAALFSEPGFRQGVATALADAAQAALP